MVQTEPIYKEFTNVDGILENFKRLLLAKQIKDLSFEYVSNELLSIEAYLNYCINVDFVKILNYACVRTINVCVRKGIFPQNLDDPSLSNN